MGGCVSKQSSGSSENTKTSQNEATKPEPLAPTIASEEATATDTQDKEVWDLSPMTNAASVVNAPSSSDSTTQIASTSSTNAQTDKTAQQRRRRLSLSTVEANEEAADLANDRDTSVALGGEPAGLADSTGSTAVPSGVEAAEVGVAPKARRGSIVKIEDPTIELYDRARRQVKDVTIEMIQRIVPESTCVAVFGSPSYDVQRSFDSKFQETTSHQGLFGEVTAATSEALCRVGIGLACKKGLKPESPNQDDFFILRVDDWHLYGVFDGHGPFGHEISAFAHKTLPFLLVSDPCFESNPKKALQRAFLRTNELLLAASQSKQSPMDCALSGTTGTVVLHRDNVLYVAHVGDSRAVLAKKCPQTGNLITVDMTQDHKPTLPGERKRIESMGGDVKRVEGDVPHRVFVHNRMYPGLAMSRALGDAIAMRVGVTAEPECNEFPFGADPNDLFFIIATDGVWEFIGSNQATKLVYKKKVSQVDKAAENLALESWRRWVEQEDNVVDDITCICIWNSMHAK